MIAVRTPSRRLEASPLAAARPGGRCLVVSADQGLRRRIAAAARACGWACSDPADAASLAAAGGGFGTVFIDLVHPPPGVVTDDLTAAFAAERDTRIVACGASNRPDEELRARESGASVYVPGVDTGPGLSALVRAVCR